jgi:hypothetical protein
MPTPSPPMLSMPPRSSMGRFWPTTWGIWELTPRQQGSWPCPQTIDHHSLAHLTQRFHQRTYECLPKVSLAPSQIWSSCDTWPEIGKSTKLVSVAPGLDSRKKLVDIDSSVMHSKATQVISADNIPGLSNLFIEISDTLDDGWWYVFYWFTQQVSSQPKLQRRRTGAYTDVVEKLLCEDWVVIDQDPIGGSKQKDRHIVRGFGVLPWAHTLQAK